MESGVDIAVRLCLPRCAGKLQLAVQHCQIGQYGIICPDRGRLAYELFRRGLCCEHFGQQPCIQWRDNGAAIEA